MRDPRGVLREFGLDLSDDVTLRVHDSTADMRYMVLPLRPDGTDGWGRDGACGAGDPGQSDRRGAGAGAYPSLNAFVRACVIRKPSVAAVPVSTVPQMTSAMVIVAFQLRSVDQFVKSYTP